MLRILPLALVVLALAGCSPPQSGSPSPSQPESSGPTPGTVTESVRVVFVIDGDTIVVERGVRRERVRYVGIDAPERDECYGSEATSANERLVEDRTVFLERDVSETDRFGRLLRYVWVEAAEGWVLVNVELVRGGFAEAGDYPPDEARDEELEAAESVARTDDRGLWEACPGL